VRFIAVADPVVQVRESAAKKARYLTFRFFTLSICDPAACSIGNPALSRAITT
jgi:hypothetical protein